MRPWTFLCLRQSQLMRDIIVQSQSIPGWKLNHIVILFNDHALVTFSGH